MSVLLQIMFETGDTDPTHASYMSIVHSGREAAEEIEDSLSSYIESNLFDEVDVVDGIITVLNESGYEWEPLDDNFVPECSDGFYQILI